MKSHDLIEKEEFGKLLGKRIRVLREKKGISLRDFEMLEGSIDRQALSKIEKGLKMPSTYTLYRIAKVLGVKLEDILKDLA